MFHPLTSNLYDAYINIHDFHDILINFSIYTSSYVKMFLSCINIFFSKIFYIIDDLYSFRSYSTFLVEQIERAFLNENNYNLPLKFI